MRKEQGVGGAGSLRGPSPRCLGEAGWPCGRGLLPTKGLECSVFIVTASGSCGKVLSRQRAGLVLGPCGGWTGNQEAGEEVGQRSRGAVGSRGEGKGRETGPRRELPAGVRDGGGEKNTPGSIMMDPPPGQDTLRGRPVQGKLLNSAWDQPVSVGHPTIEETKLRRSGSQSRIWEP